MVTTQRRALARVLALTACTAALTTGLSTAQGPARGAPPAGPGDGRILLPAPVRTLPTFSGLGLRPDRRLVSSVPGPVRTSEQVTVAVGGDGRAAEVALDEHLALTGVGNYLIYERGPAREARPLGDSVPPVLKLGTVIWQGFSPGRRDLAARLRLDPALEAERLPLRVTVSFRPTAAGVAGPLGPGGAAPGSGTVTVRLANTTALPQVLPTGVAPAGALAGPLDALLDAARRSAARPRTALPLPVAGDALPASVPASAVAAATTTVYAPLRVTGTIRATDPGATLSGPAVTPVARGGRVAGVLSGEVEFTLRVPGPTRVVLDLHAVPTLDERSLTPPGAARTWATWARTPRSTAELGAATAQLVSGAAMAARAAAISPYVGADTPGQATTVFRYRLADAARVVAAPATLHPKPLALGVVGVAALAVLANAAAIWRRL